MMDYAMLRLGLTLNRILVVWVRRGFVDVDRFASGWLRNSQNWYKFEFSMCAFDYRIGGGLVHHEVVIPAALSFLPLLSVAVGRAPTIL